MKVRLLEKEQVVSLLFRGLRYCRHFVSFLYNFNLNLMGLPSALIVASAILSSTMPFSVTFSSLTPFFSLNLWSRLLLIREPLLPVVAPLWPSLTVATKTLAAERLRLVLGKPPSQRIAS